MNYEIINVGELPNDGTGDPVRVAFIKINNNFSSISNTISPIGETGSIQFKSVNLDGNGNVISNSLTGSSNLRFISSTNTLNLQGKIVPFTDEGLQIGETDKRISNLYLSSDALRIGNIEVTEVENSLNFQIFDSGQKPTFNFGNLSVTSNLSYSNSKFSSTTATTTTDGDNIIILSVPLSDIKTGIFNISSRRFSTVDSQTATLEVHVNNLGTNVKHTVYGTIFSGNVLTTYDVAINTGNVEVSVSPFYDDTINHTIDYKLIK